MTATRRYARNTTVSTNRTQQEIQETLKAYGATGFGFMEENAQSVIIFRIKEYTIRYKMKSPERSKVRTPTGKYPQNMERAYEQEVRRRWRVLLLAIKAKLELVSMGIASIEEEFLSSIVMVSGQTVGEWALPQLEQIKAGSMLPMLPGVSMRNVLQLPPGDDDDEGDYIDAETVS